MNKKAKSMNPIVWVIIALAVAYFVLPQILPDTDATTGRPVPSDLKQTHTLSFKDALATTETTVDATWYAFNGDGTFFNSGTASSGTSSVDLVVDETYTIWSWLSTAGSEYLPERTTLTTDSEPLGATTIRLTAASIPKISALENADDDSNDNLTATAGATGGFNVKFAVNKSNAGAEVLLFLYTNDTTRVDDINVGNDNKGGTWSEITCPDRFHTSISEISGMKEYCFERAERAHTADSTITVPFTIEYDDTTAPAATDLLYVGLMDRYAYLKPGYENVNDIIIDYEDQSDSDVGLGDSEANLAFDFSGA